MSVRTLRYNTATQHFTKSALASTDRDALAFLEAAQIYNTNQQRAIVNLVRSLKRVGLWSKMKAIYPFVGGTATSHKWNLKDPRDVDAAFRLSFVGGWTHSSTGADPNGTNGYASTYLIPSSKLTNNNTHISNYVREGFANSASTRQLYTSGVYDGLYAYGMYLSTYKLANSSQATTGMNGGNNISKDFYVNISSQVGLFTATVRSTGANDHKAFQNATTLGTNTASAVVLARYEICLGALSYFTSANGYQVIAYTDQQLAFATIGDGLTDSDATNLYNIVQRYQFQLGRAIEPDAQAFIDAAGITDATQQAAILDLVVRLKNDGLWSKMKAIYPFVGGTASSHKWNLKDPRDVDAAYRLTFSGGWTHSSTGADPNGTNAYANTFMQATALSQDSAHYAIYLREATDGLYVDIGATSDDGTPFPSSSMFVRYNGDLYGAVNQSNAFAGIKGAVTNSQGLFTGTRTSSTLTTAYRNTSSVGTTTQVSTTPTVYNYYLAANNRSNIARNFTNREFAFATLGDGLSSTEVSNLYTIVDLFQKRLGRAV